VQWHLAEAWKPLMFGDVGPAEEARVVPMRPEAPRFTLSVALLWSRQSRSMMGANMRKRRWLDLKIALAMIVLLVFVPVALPMVVVLTICDDRRMRAAARKFVCLFCGSNLGEEAICLADEAWRHHFSETRANNPGVRFRIERRRIVRHLRAICPHRGARYGYVERARTFVAISDDCW
jgi:hypothetical protein